MLRRFGLVAALVRLTPTCLSVIAAPTMMRAPATVLSEGVFTVSLRGANSASQEHGAVYTLKETSPAPKGWEARLLAENINESRRHFGWVLVDAPSLRQSELALALAPHTDG